MVTTNIVLQTMAQVPLKQLARANDVALQKIGNRYTLHYRFVPQYSSKRASISYYFAQFHPLPISVDCKTSLFVSYFHDSLFHFISIFTPETHQKVQQARVLHFNFEDYVLRNTLTYGFSCDH